MVVWDKDNVYVDFFFLLSKRWWRSDEPQSQDTKLAFIACKIQIRKGTNKKSAISFAFRKCKGHQYERKELASQGTMWPTALYKELWHIQTHREVGRTWSIIKKKAFLPQKETTLTTLICMIHVNHQWGRLFDSFKLLKWNWKCNLQEKILSPFFTARSLCYKKKVLPPGQFLKLVFNY